MREIAVLSGKGGTGKTSIVASFARLAGRVVAADCDVDAANLAILMDATERESGTFVSGTRATVNRELCTGCLACVDACRFGALSVEDDLPHVDRLACHGCGVCRVVCPAEAVRFEPNVAGRWIVSETPTGPLVHAELAPGQGSSGKLVTEVRRRGLEAAAATGTEMVLLDGPPGVGCPVHATLAGASTCLAVVEPTLSGEHDLARLAELVRSHGIPLVLVVNKHDLAPGFAARMRALAGRLGAPVLAELPFDARVPRASSAGEPMLAVPSLVEPLRRAFRALLDR